MNGRRRPGNNQTSIIFRYDVFGRELELLSYNVYITNIDVKATIVVASKWDSSIYIVISAANNVHIEGRYVVAMKYPYLRVKVNSITI